MNKKISVGLVTTYALFAFVIGFSPATTRAATIVDVAVGNPNFSSLVGAVTSQGLVDTLNSTGPFTVFAPTNSAFSSIQPIISEALTAKPELLKQVLLYHVVPGTYNASDVLSAKTLTTAQGGKLMPRMIDGSAYVNTAKISATDIAADNGVVHVIDSVLVPREVIVEAIKMKLEMLRGQIGMLQAAAQSSHNR